jgi:hypothetical protein
LAPDGTEIIEALPESETIIIPEDISGSEDELSEETSNSEEIEGDLKGEEEEESSE